MQQILSFGEILIRQQSQGLSFFGSDSNLLEIFPGGSEANVAASLALMGNSVAYMTAMPENALSTEVIHVLQQHKVDTRKIIFTGDRIGSYLLLSADGLTKGEVIYDRKYSSFSQLKISELPLAEILEGVSWLHWTALSPALNQDMANLMEALLQAAHDRNIPISVDLNYRNKLWQYGKEPIEVMPKLVQYCTVIMGNIWAANKMLGIGLDANLDRYTSKENYLQAAANSAQEIFKAYPNCKHLAYTFRFMDNPQHNLFYGTYHCPGQDLHSETFETNQLVDRIGSGDAFMAGFIHALVRNLSPQEIIDTATGAGFQKLFVRGDFGNGKIK